MAAGAGIALVDSVVMSQSSSLITFVTTFLLSFTIYELFLISLLLPFTSFKHYISFKPTNIIQLFR